MRFDCHVGFSLSAELEEGALPLLRARTSRSDIVQSSGNVDTRRMAVSLIGSIIDDHSKLARSFPLYSLFGFLNQRLDLEGFPSAIGFFRSELTRDICSYQAGIIFQHIQT
jgi:hypothetical protein